jgi:hypothetical protein
VLSSFQEVVTVSLCEFSLRPSLLVCFFIITELNASNNQDSYQTIQMIYKRLVIYC